MITMSNDFDEYTLLPAYSSVDNRNDISLSTRLTKKLKLSIPLVSSPMSTVTELDMALAMSWHGGAGVIHRYMPIKEQAHQIHQFRKQSKGIIGAAIGVKDGMERIKFLESTHPPNFYMFDIANGDLKECYDITEEASSKDIEIISGNIVTHTAAKRYAEAGIAGFRVGVGSGSVCTTRRVTGFGRNQVLAIQYIHDYFPDIPITSCGGIRYSGDIVKALAFGAESVLIGRLFATCDESSAPRLPDGRITYGGMASFFSENMRAERTGEKLSDIHHSIAPEGVHEILESTGPVAKTIERLLGGIKSGLAYYGGSRHIKEFQEKIRYE